MTGVGKEKAWDAVGTDMDVHRENDRGIIAGEIRSESLIQVPARRKCSCEQNTVRREQYRISILFSTTSELSDRCEYPTWTSASSSQKVTDSTGKQTRSRSSDSIRPLSPLRSPNRQHLAVLRTSTAYCSLDSGLPPSPGTAHQALLSPLGSWLVGGGKSIPQTIKRRGGLLTAPHLITRRDLNMSRCDISPCCDKGRGSHCGRCLVRICLQVPFLPVDVTEPQISFQAYSPAMPPQYLGGPIVLIKVTIATFVLIPTGQRERTSREPCGLPILTSCFRTWPIKIEAVVDTQSWDRVSNGFSLEFGRQPRSRCRGPMEQSEALLERMSGWGYFAGN